MPAAYLLLETGDHLLLESGDDVLLESSTVDQSIALAHITSGTLFAPTLDAGDIALPLIDASSTFPPTAFEDKTLALPLVDGSALYGPSLKYVISLPLVGGSAVYGPSAILDVVLALPLIDPAVLYGPTLRYDDTLDLPLIDGGWPYSPSLLGPLIAGLQLFVGANELGSSFARAFVDELSGVGSFRVSLANDDPDLPAFDDVVQYRLNGSPVFAGLVEQRTVVTKGAGEEDDEVTVCKGRGTLALTDFGTIEPARGLDALPVQVTRSYSWLSFDFDTPWPNAKRTQHPSHGRPEWWPDMGSWWVWADRPDVTPTSAPGGRCLFRSTFTLDEDSLLRIFVSSDNRGTWWFDEGELTDLDDGAYRTSQFVDLEATAGEHLICASVLNTGRHGGMIFTVYKVDADGLLDEVVHRSDALTVDCLGYPYPTHMPGFTAGKAIRLMVEAAQARGDLLGISLGFTDTLDSDGQPWQQVAEITVDCGRSVLDALLGLADWLIDVQMAPGANVLLAWNHGTRGGTAGVSIAMAADPYASEVESLQHDGRLTRATRLLLKYRGGLFTEVGTPGRTRFVDVGNVTSETAAQRIGEQLLGFRNVESYAHTLTLAPAVDPDTGEVTAIASVPYDRFDNGDTIDHGDETGGTASSRVRSIELAENDDGELTWKLGLNDVHLEAAERYDNQLKISAMGTLAGGGRVMSKSGEPLRSSVRVVAREVVEFSADEVTASTSLYRTAHASGNAIELFVEVTPEDFDALPSSATRVRVYKDGTQIGSDVVVPAGQLDASVRLTGQKIYQNVSRFHAVAVTVGSGVRGIGVQVRAI